jgi:MraZ protein
MSAVGTSVTGLYTGCFTHGVDASDRVMVPSVWRPADPDTVFAVIPWPLDQPEFLLVLPPARWQAMIDRLKAAASLTNPKFAKVERKLAGSTFLMKMDKAGRFCLGEKLTAKAGIGEEATLVGRLDKFEIWDAARQEAAEAEDTPISPEELESMML